MSQSSSNTVIQTAVQDANGNANSNASAAERAAQQARFFVIGALIQDLRSAKSWNALEDKALKMAIKAWFPILEGIPTEALGSKQPNSLYHIVVKQGGVEARDVAALWEAHFLPSMDLDITEERRIQREAAEGSVDRSGDQQLLRTWLVQRGR